MITHQKSKASAPKKKLLPNKQKTDAFAKFAAEFGPKDGDKAAATPVGAVDFLLKLRGKQA